MIWDSFFDDLEGRDKYCIWKKDVSETDYAAIKRPGAIVHEGLLSKFDKEKQAFKQYYFILTKDRLYYKKVLPRDAEKKPSRY